MRGMSVVYGFLSFVLLLAASFAGEVDLPYTFQPNTPARAEEVNANFNEVKQEVNDNYLRIQDLEDFRSNVAGSECPDGEAVRGFSRDGLPFCEDMNKGKRVLSVTYPASCFAAIRDPSLSSVGVNTDRATIFDINGNDDPNWIYCPITLPEGVKILKIILHLHDRSNVNNLEATFYHRPDLGHPSHFIGSTNGNSGDQQLVLDLSAENEVVLNGVGYGIYVYFPSDQDCPLPPDYCVSSENLGVHRVTIIYEYDPTYSLDMD